MLKLLPAALSLFAIAALSGCPDKPSGGASGSATATGMKVAPVAFTIDAKASGAIDGARLGAAKPDFDDEGRRGWLLSSLLAGRYKPDMAVEAEDDDGRRTLLRRGGAAKSRVVMLTVSDGRIGVALVAQDDPFGGGERAGRGKARLPSVKAVKRLWLRTEKPRAKPKGPAFALQVELEAGDPTRWTEDDFGKVEQRKFTPGDGEGRRAAWSLRDLATTLIGAGARVTSIRGEGGDTPISEKHWNDKSRTPLLRVNRRGQLKFVWVGADMTPLEDEPVVRRVRTLRALQP